MSEIAEIREELRAMESRLMQALSARPIVQRKQRDHKFLTIGEAATINRKGRKAIRQLIAKGLVKSRKVKGRGPTGFVTQVNATEVASALESLK